MTRRMYMEEPPSQSPSSATKSRQHDAFEKELDEITTYSDIADYDLTGKAAEQMDAIIAQYHRDVKASRIW